MVNLTTRVLNPELLDSGMVSDEEVRRSLLDLRRINRFFEGRRILVDAVMGELNRHQLSTCSILDVAAGSCDLPIAILNATRRQGIQAQVYALEYQHRHLALFRSELRSHQNLHPLCADALCAPFADRSFDIVTCSLFLHHLTEEQAVRLLSHLCRWARHAIIINDLERHSIPYYFFRLFGRILTSTAVSYYDGLISIRQSYRKGELAELGAKAGLKEQVAVRRWPFRLVMTAQCS